MLTSVYIENFRGIANLRLTGLSRVNLVVGRNNTGKTSFLEAVRILVQPDKIGELGHVFRNFEGSPISRWLIRDHPGVHEALLKAQGENGSSERIVILKDKKETAGQKSDFVSFGWDGHIEAAAKKTKEPLKSCSISVLQRGPSEIIDAFTEAVRSADGEAQMEAMLKTVDSRIRAIRLDLTGRQHHSSSPQIVVDLGLRERVPLTQTGQGIYRLVSIFSELLGQRPQICFIDEIENGIYHAALKQVWTGIAVVAERMGIQVFATTHSWECIVAAHQAFCDQPKYDFRIVQLYRVGDRTEGRVLDRELIEAGVQGNIDLR